MPYLRFSKFDLISFIKLDLGCLTCKWLQKNWQFIFFYYKIATEDEEWDDTNLIIGDECH